jgi:hypothetical protein
MGCFRVIQNSVQFHQERSILSPADKMTKNESKSDFLHKISNEFVCIFSNISIFGEIEAICIDCDHGISKCPSISERFPPDNRPRDAF